MNLPEIAEKLYSKGFTVEIDESHRMIAVSLNRKVSISEVEAALDYEIASSIRFNRYNGRVIISQ